MNDYEHWVFDSEHKGEAVNTNMILGKSDKGAGKQKMEMRTEVVTSAL